MPLPRLAPGLTRTEWLAAMRDWADAHVDGSERWAVAHAAISEIEAFELPADRATEIIRAAASWEPAT
ncbi:hypothetical protein V2J52_02820 [Georgenia sp. MJ173]|uniref:hypothetical protein n=1 Tax=Georgenia sunbinii TaxID=3117728 RepID=UPI002F25F5CD